MEAEDYLGGNRLFRRLKNGPHGELVERYARRLVEERLARKGTRQCLNVVGGLLDWIAKRRCMLANIDEHVVERYLRHRASRQSVQTGNRAALKRWLSVLRDEGAIAPAAPPRLTPHEQIFKEFEDYLRTERGLAPRSIIRHLPTIRRFLHEVCGAGADGLGKISQESVIGYIERHARDWSPSTGKTMCWSLRAFLRYVRVGGGSSGGGSRKSRGHRDGRGEVQPICAEADGGAVHLMVHSGSACRGEAAALVCDPAGAA